MAYRRDRVLDHHGDLQGFDFEGPFHSVTGGYGVRKGGIHTIDYSAHFNLVLLALAFFREGPAGAFVRGFLALSFPTC